MKLLVVNAVPDGAGIEFLNLNCITLIENTGNQSFVIHTNIYDETGSYKKYFIPLPIREGLERIINLSCSDAWVTRLVP